MTIPTDLDETFRDKMDPKGNCPGFSLYTATGTDGTRYLVSADYPGAVQVRVYMRSNGTKDVDMASIELVGPNPDKVAWEQARRGH